MRRALAIALLIFSVSGDTTSCDDGQSTPWQQVLRRLACPLLRRLSISLSICSASRFEQSRHNGVAVLPSTSAPEVDVPNPRLLVHVRGAVQMRELPLHSGVVPPSGAHSYNETELLSGDVEAEMRRLQLQVDLTFRKEERLMRWYGLTDGMAVLEFGCGPGWTTLRFAEALPASPITCVEKSPRFVAEARRKLDAAGVSSARVTFVHAVAEESGLPDASYDMATFRFVLQHLRQPSRALAEAHRVLRPRGLLVVVETDDMLGGVMDPYPEALHNPSISFSALQRSRGGSRFIGRHVRRLASKAGFGRLELEAVLAASDEFSNRAQSLADHFDPLRYKMLVQMGLLTTSDYSRLVEQMHVFANSPGAIALMVHVMALGMKEG